MIFPHREIFFYIVRLNQLLPVMKKVILLLTIVLFAQHVFAQKTITEWSQLDEKKFGKKMQYSTQLNNLKRYIKSADQLPPLKKAGIFCYYFFSPTPTMRDVNLLEPAHIKAAGSAWIVDKLFEKAEPGLKDGFSQKNVKLLAINEYLDTDEKKSLYENTEFKASKLSRGTAAFAAFFTGRASRGDARATPEGYKLVMETNWDIKIARSIGDYAKKIGIDALVDIKQTVWWDGKKLALGPIIMDVIGPNPVPKSEDDWYAPAGPLKGYVEGWLFGSVIVEPPKPYEIGFVKKKEISLNVDDLDIVYSRIAQNLVDYVNEQIGKLVK